MIEEKVELSPIMAKIFTYLQMLKEREKVPIENYGYDRYTIVSLLKYQNIVKQFIQPLVDKYNHLNIQTLENSTIVTPDTKPNETIIQEIKEIADKIAEAYKVKVTVAVSDDEQEIAIIIPFEQIAKFIYKKIILELKKHNSDKWRLFELKGGEITIEKDTYAYALIIVLKEKEKIELNEVSKKL